MTAFHLNSNHCAQGVDLQVPLYDFNELGLSETPAGHAQALSA
jgi:hypothetical protein